MMPKCLLGFFKLNKLYEITIVRYKVVYTENEIGILVVLRLLLR